MQLRGPKPLPPSYPTALDTLGQRLRKRRLDLGLRQKDVAQALGVSVDTVTNWEVGRTEPALRFLPALARFLGEDQVNAPQGALPFSARLQRYRRAQGLSQKRLAELLGVDPSTVWHWEDGRGRPHAARRAVIETLLAAPHDGSHEVGLKRPMAEPLGAQITT